MDSDFFPYFVPLHGRVHRLESGAKRAPKDTAEEIRDLRESVDRLSLVCRAMWELLKESGGLTEEALLQKVEDVDLTDGNLDGKHKPAPHTCPSCSRPNHSKRRLCLYCGAELAPPSAFDAV